MTKPSSKPVCVVVGVGPGNGAALARRFASEGYRVALLARHTDVTQPLAAKLEGARAYACDTTDAASVERTFGAIRTELGDVDVLVYNAGVGVWANVEDVTAEAFETSWRTNVLGALLTSKQVIPAMKKNKHGNIVFIGATASRRGGPRTAAFAPAKAAQKSLAESMARHLWPAGIHVALIILDGVVDTPIARQRLSDKPDSCFIKPADVAPTTSFGSRSRNRRAGRSRPRRARSARCGRACRQGGPKRPEQHSCPVPRQLPRMAKLWFHAHQTDPA